MIATRSWTLACASMLLGAACSSAGPSKNTAKTDSAQTMSPDSGSACDAVVPAGCPHTKPSFKNDVFPVLKAKCNTCHQVDSPHWPFDNYKDVFHWSEQIESDLATCSMPPQDAGETLSAKERETIIAWTICGSPNN